VRITGSSSKSGNGLPSSFHHHADYLRRLYSADRLCAGWLGTPLLPGSVTRGIPIGIGVIVISFVLTGFTSGGRTVNLIV
jgi:hypothetical protein